jgi:class 3 adenylate cyclase/predicted esterase
VEQQIRFCTTSDGVRIAYAATGDGPPLVRVLGWFTHLELDWEAPWIKAGVEAQAQRYTFIRYDGRGMGLSDREAGDFSVESVMKDLEAVVDASGFRRVALFALSQGGPVAIAYATRHPERVSHLILYGSFAQAPQPRNEGEAELRKAMVTLIREGWGSDSPAYRQTFTSLFMPNADPERMRWFDRLQRASTPADSAATLFSQIQAYDVSDIVASLKVPTLVFHCRGDQVVPFEQGRELAAAIPNARFVPLESDNHAIDTQEPAWQVLEQAMDEFLSESAKPARRKSARSKAHSGLVTILFTDMESSSALRQQLGDAKAQELVRTHNTIVRQALKSHAGAEIKHTGDGIMASFPSAIGALECAVAIQRGVAAYLAAHPEAPLGVYVGLNAGEPIAEEQDLFGTSVDLARRLCDQAAPGEILVSNVVRELASGKGFLFSDRGAAPLKGFDDPVRLYEVRWREE